MNETWDNGGLEPMSNATLSNTTIVEILDVDQSSGAVLGIIGISILMILGFCNLLLGAYIYYLHRAAARVGTVSKYPLHENYFRSLHLFKALANHQVRIYCDFSEKKNCATKQLNEIKLAYDTGYPYFVDAVPDHARIISIRRKGFEFGTKAHEFEPTGGMAPGSFFTYQTIGRDRIQLTYYNQCGKAYLAGFCIYILSSKIMGFEYRKDVLEKITKNARPYPGRNPAKDGVVEMDKDGNCVLERKRDEVLIKKTWDHLDAPKVEVETLDKAVELQKLLEGNFKDFEPAPEPAVEPEADVRSEQSFDLCDAKEQEEEDVVKYCPRLKRKLMTSRDSDGKVMHMEWNQVMKKMKKEYCEECTEKSPPSSCSLISLV